MEKRTGIIGLTGAFREALSGLPDGGKVVFAGSVAVCTPFAELLAYAVKDRSFDLIYIPRADAAQARPVRWCEGIGFSVVEGASDPSDPDAVVFLGGLAMPKFGCPLSQAQALLVQLGRSTRPKVVGVSFMGIFQRSGWSEALPFDVIIDATMEVEAQECQARAPSPS